MNKTLQMIISVSALAVLATGCGKKTQTAETEKATALTVRTQPVASRSFERSLTVQGAIESKVYANVASRIAGNLESVAVDEGDIVKAGETVLFQIDPASLQKELSIAEQTLEVAKASLEVAQATATAAEAEAKKAMLDFDRYKRLHEQSKVSDNEFEARDVQNTQAKAAIDVAKANVNLTERKVAQAVASLEIARKNLADSKVVAPISGVVSSRTAEPGEQMSIGHVVLRIEDLSSKEAVAFIPARYYPEVTEGKTQFSLVMNGRDAGLHTITYRSPTVDPALRTFEIKGKIAGEGDTVVPGDMATIKLVFETRQGLSVPTAAVVFRNGKNIVFVVENNQAVEREVTIGLENDFNTEIRSGLKAGEVVVTEGQSLLSNGRTVSVL